MQFTISELKDFKSVLKKLNLSYTPPICNICKHPIDDFITPIQKEYGKTIYCIGTYCHHCGAWTPGGHICISDSTEDQPTYELTSELIRQSLRINFNNLQNILTPGYNY